MEAKTVVACLQFEPVVGELEANLQKGLSYPNAWSLSVGRVRGIQEGHSYAGAK